MKTPREILLARHQSAEPKLDALRQATVAAVCDRRTTASQPDEQPAKNPRWNPLALLLAVPNTLWRELILPSRRLWTGLATIWILVVIINVSQRDSISSVTGQPVRSQPVMMSWQTQQRLMNELLADRAEPPPEADRPRNTTPRPRTEIYETMTA